MSDIRRVDDTKENICNKIDKATFKYDFEWEILRKKEIKIFLSNKSHLLFDYLINILK